MSKETFNPYGMETNKEVTISSYLEQKIHEFRRNNIFIKPTIIIIHPILFNKLMNEIQPHYFSMFTNKPNYKGLRIICSSDLEENEIIIH